MYARARRVQRHAAGGEAGAQIRGCAAGERFATGLDDPIAGLRGTDASRRSGRVRSAAATRLRRRPPARPTAAAAIVRRSKWPGQRREYGEGEQRERGGGERPQRRAPWRRPRSLGMTAGCHPQFPLKLSASAHARSRRGGLTSNRRGRRGDTASAPIIGSLAWTNAQPARAASLSCETRTPYPRSLTQIAAAGTVCASRAEVNLTRLVAIGVARARAGRGVAPRLPRLGAVTMETKLGTTTPNEARAAPASAGQ